MSRRLPNLNQLRAFEAAARHLSFKAAAEELHVTDAAISHQIKALEADLGTALFQRSGRGVLLAPAALKLAETLTSAFDLMGQAIANYDHETNDAVLRISAVPAYGNRLIVPNLPAFAATHPDIKIELSLEVGLADLAAGEADGGIRYGKGDWPGLDARLLHRDMLAPVCAPELVAGRRLPLDPAEIVQMPVALPPGAALDWANWQQAMGAEGALSGPIQRMENRAIAIDYLTLGYGVALYDLRFAAHELATGKLVRLHPSTIEGQNGIYLVSLHAATPDPWLLAFGTWLAGVAGQIDLSCGCPWD
jgi:LysR family glycine cleavage system transcriptional activator